MKEFKLKNPQEIGNMFYNQGFEDIKPFEEIIDYIDKLHKNLLSYQSFIEFMEYTVKNHNKNVSL